MLDATYNATPLASIATLWTMHVLPKSIGEAPTRPSCCLPKLQRGCLATVKVTLTAEVTSQTDMRIRRMNVDIFR
jgi:hypothetical protein